MNNHNHRDRQRIANDLEGRNLGFDQVDRIITMTSDYVGESCLNKARLETDMDIMAFLAGASALLKQTLRQVGKIEDELRTGERDADAA